MNQSKGKRSIEFINAPVIYESACVVGKKEGEGPLREVFDYIEEDGLFGTDTWEKAESALQQKTVDILFEKSGLSRTDIRYVFAGDLMGQLIATTFGMVTYNIPLFGLYGACSTMGESLSLAAMTVGGGYAPAVMAMASSHYASAEKTFRFPLEYGNQRPFSATWTVTGCGAVIVGSQDMENEIIQQSTQAGKSRESDKEKTQTEICAKDGIKAKSRTTAKARTTAKPRMTAKARITGITTGKIVDLGCNDSMNMGACMAPAAADVITSNLNDFNIKPDEYDRIITGDLGYVGQKILLDILQKNGIDISKQHMDCGIEIFDSERQDTHAGGSGCGCSATVLCGLILDKLRKHEWNKVLFIPTGALLSPVSYNEGQTVPGIAHGVVIESITGKEK